MKRIRSAFLLLGLILFFLFFEGCVETRQKDITTDSNGSAEGTFVITQDCKIAFTSYTCNKQNCGSNLQIQVTLTAKDNSPKENIIIVTANQLSTDLNPISTKFGDRLVFKISNGCPNAKYTITFTLDAGS